MLKNYSTEKIINFEEISTDLIIVFITKNRSQRFCETNKMENLTNNQEVTTVEPTTKKEWIKPEMVEIEVMFSSGKNGDGSGAS